MKNLFTHVKLLVLACLILTITFSISVRALGKTWLPETSINYNKDSLKNIIKVFPASQNIKTRALITFTVTKVTKVNIIIIDVNGLEVANLMNKNIPAGTFSLLLETKHLRKGMYYCKFQTDEKIAMKKMIMVN